MTSEVHASEEMIEEYSRGTLPEAEAACFEEHLLICPRCQSGLAEMDAFVNATRQAAMRLRMEPPAASQEAWSWLWRRLLRPAPLAAGAAGLAALLTWVALTRPAPSQAVPVVSLYLQAIRGGDALVGARAPAGRPLLLKLDPAGLPALQSYHLEIVDARGAAVLEASAPRGANVIAVEVTKRLAAGRYWVRLYEPSPARTLLREFALRID